MEEVQDGPALAADGTVKSVPDGRVHGVVGGVQAGDGDQRAGRTAQLGREVEFAVVRHRGERRLREYRFSTVRGEGNLTKNEKKTRLYKTEPRIAYYGRLVTPATCRCYNNFRMTK